MPVPVRIAARTAERRAGSVPSGKRYRGRGPGGSSRHLRHRAGPERRRRASVSPAAIFGTGTAATGTPRASHRPAGAGAAALRAALGRGEVYLSSEEGRFLPPSSRGTGAVRAGGEGTP